MKRLSLYISLLFVLTCAKEDSQAPNTPPTQIVKQYALTASAGDGGSVTGGGTFASGTQVSLTATPSSGYNFSGWSNGSSANPLTVTLNSNTSITANFQVIVNSYTLTVSAQEGGSVSTEGGEYEEGTEVDVTATSDEGYEFVGWSDGETSIERVIILTTNLNLESLFRPLVNPFEGISTPNYLNPSHLTRIPYLHRNYDEMYNTYGTGLVIDNLGGSPKDAVVIDYNGDGYYDLVHSGVIYEKSFNAAIPDDDPLGNQHRNKIQFFKGDEFGYLSLDIDMSNKFWGLIHGYKGNVNDYNNDGIPDILFAGTGWHGPSINNSPDQYLNHEYPTMLLSNGVGNYEQVNLYDLDGYHHSISSGDYDNDGDVDIITIDPRTKSEWVSQFGMSVGRILKNNGSGTFEIIELIETISYDNNQSFESINALVPNVLSSVPTHEVFDINDDGFLDLILGGGFDSAGAKILLGNGVDFNNGIIELPPVPNFDLIIDFTINDYDNDGDKDIIVNRIPDGSSGGSSYGGWYIQVLTNTGGQFTDDTSLKINENYLSGGCKWVRFIHISDFDNDGNLELFNNEIERDFNYTNSYLECDNPKLEWELINGIFIRHVEN